MKVALDLHEADQHTPFQDERAEMWFGHLPGDRQKPKEES
jgi:hypothetical protein